MKNLENEKKVIFFITIVWAIISLAGGIIFWEHPKVCVNLQTDVR